jgi:hypothetical protein
MSGSGARGQDAAQEAGAERRALARAWGRRQAPGGREQAARVTKRLGLGAGSWARKCGAQAQMQAAAGVERGCGLAARVDSAAQARANGSWST